MLKGLSVLIGIILLLVITVNQKPIKSTYFPPKTLISEIFKLNVVSFFRKKGKLKSRNSIKQLCHKTKQKIKQLERKAKQKSTPGIQRCKRAYSELRYQACHLKKYNQKKIDSVANCR